MNDHLFARIKPEPNLVSMNRLNYREIFGIRPIYTGNQCVFLSVLGKNFSKFWYDLSVKRGASTRWSPSLYCPKRNLDQMTIGKTHPSSHSSHIKNSKISFRTPIEPDISLHDVYIYLWKNAIKSYRVFKSNPKSMFRSSIVFDSWTKNISWIQLELFKGLRGWEFQKVNFKDYVHFDDFQVHLNQFEINSLLDKMNSEPVQVH